MTNRSAWSRCVFLLCVLWATPTLAIDFSAPQTIPYEGYLEADGQPVSNDVTMNFALFPCDAPVDCEPVWLADGVWAAGFPEGAGLTVTVQAGRFVVNLGGQGTASLPPDVLARPVLFLLTQVEGVTLPATQRIGAAPAAWNGVPAGTIMAFGGTAAPAGWAACDGHGLDRADYPALFAAIGTSWGAPDGDTFRVPDLRGRFLRGVDGGAGRDPNRAGRTAIAPGGSSGDAVGSLQGWATARPRTSFSTGTEGAHVHPVDDYYFSENHGGNWGWFGSGDSDWDNRGHSTLHDTHSAGGHSHTVSGGGDSETRPDNANVLFIIKL